MNALSALMAAAALAATAEASCFTEGKRYVDVHVKAPVINVKSEGACQELCREKQGCGVFTFYRDSNSCWLQDPGSSILEDYNGTSAAGEEGAAALPAAVVGPVMCPPTPAPTPAPTPLPTLATAVLTTTEAAAGSSEGSSLDSLSSSSPGNSSPSSSLPNWAWWLLALGLLCCCLLGGAGGLLAGGKKKSKKTSGGRKSKKGSSLGETAPMVAPAVFEYPVVETAPAVVAPAVQMVQQPVTSFTMQPAMAAPVVEYVQQPMVVQQPTASYRMQPAASLQPVLGASPVATYSVR